MNSCSLPLMCGGERNSRVVRPSRPSACGSAIGCMFILSFVCRRAAWRHTDRVQVEILIFHGRRDPPGGCDISGRYRENTKNEDQATIVEVTAEQGTSEDQRGHR